MLDPDGQIPLKGIETEDGDQWICAIPGCPIGNANSAASQSSIQE
jgi:hypothetical protein